MFTLKMTSLVSAVIIFTLMLGCLQNPARVEFGEVTYSNTSDELLFTHFNMGGGATSIEPGDTKTVRYEKPRFGGYADQRYDSKDDPVRFYFFDGLGCTALTIRTTLRQLEDDFDSYLSIGSEHLTPFEERVDCNLTRLGHGASLPRPPVDDVR